MQVCGKQPAVRNALVLPSMNTGIDLIQGSTGASGATAWEAAIASVHGTAHRTEETDWGRIVSLYDTLMAIRPSPVVALNRAIAIAQHEGPKRGLEEIHSIARSDRLATYPFYFAALGDLELRSGRPQAANEHFRAALAVARNPMERRFLEQRVAVSASRVAQQH